MTAASFSRGAIFAVMAAFALLHARRNQFLLIAVITGVLVLPLLPVSSILVGNFRGESRYGAWAVAIQQTDILSGPGFGGSEEVQREQLVGALPLEFQSINLSNSYIQLAYELGLLPGVLFLLAAGGLIAAALRAPHIHPVAPALFAVIIFGLVSAFVETWMFSSGSIFCLVFWLAVASLIALRADASSHGGVV
jgi:hypothetical protein